MVLAGASLGDLECGGETLRKRHGGGTDKTSCILPIVSISCPRVFFPCGLPGSSGVRTESDLSVLGSRRRGAAQESRTETISVVTTQRRSWLPKVDCGSLGPSQTALGLQGSEK